MTLSNSKELVLIDPEDSVDDMFDPEQQIRCCTQSAGLVRAFVSVESEKIPLWKLDSLLTWAIDSDSFPSTAHCKFAEEQMNEALNSWSTGMVSSMPRFMMVKNKDECSFCVRYSSTPGNAGVMARAFLPQTKKGDVVIYPFAFSHTSYIDRLVNVFKHELGHVIGLRHEFASQESSPAMKIGQDNPDSVMNYNDKPEIQDSDREIVNRIYSGEFEKIELIPINRIEPAFAGK